MGLNANNARIFGSDLDAIWLGPLTAIFPEEMEDPGDGFEDVGWLHSDGITEAATGSKAVIRGHQGAGVVRTRLEEPGTTIAFVALESKPQTKSLRYDEQDVDATTPGVRKVRRGAGQRVQARKAVVDLHDADDVTISERWLIDRFEIVPDGDRVYVNNDIAAFPFIGEIIGGYTVLEVIPALPEAVTVTFDADSKRVDEDEAEGLPEHAESFA